MTWLAIGSLGLVWGQGEMQGFIQGVLAEAPGEKSAPFIRPVLGENGAGVNHS